MTAAEAIALAKASLSDDDARHAVVTTAGADLRVGAPHGGVDVLEVARMLAGAFNTEIIDLDDRGKVKVDDWGCGSCGHGAVVIVRNIITKQE
jgi:hypothetical protein